MKTSLGTYRLKTKLETLVIPLLSAGKQSVLCTTGELAFSLLRAWGELHKGFSPD